MVFILTFLWSISLPIIAQEKGFPIPAGNSKQLFYLQRTPNKNTIVYELNYKNGDIDSISRGRTKGRPKLYPKEICLWTQNQKNCRKRV